MEKLQNITEYGACQFEYRTLPTSMEKLVDLNLELQEFIECLDKAIHKVYKDVIPAFLGGNPSPEIFKNSLITNNPRYNKLASLQSKIGGQLIHLKQKHEVASRNFIHSFGWLVAFDYSSTV